MRWDAMELGIGFSGFPPGDAGPTADERCPMTVPAFVPAAEEEEEDGSDRSRRLGAATEPSAGRWIGLEERGGGDASSSVLRR